MKRNNQKEKKEIMKRLMKGDLEKGKKKLKRKENKDQK